MTCIVRKVEVVFLILAVALSGGCGIRAGNPFVSRPLEGGSGDEQNVVHIVFRSKQFDEIYLRILGAVWANDKGLAGAVLRYPEVQEGVLKGDGTPGAPLRVPQVPNGLRGGKLYLLLAREGNELRSRDRNPVPLKVARLTGDEELYGLGATWPEPLPKKHAQDGSESPDVALTIDDSSLGGCESIDQHHALAHLSPDFCSLGDEIEASVLETGGSAQDIDEEQSQGERRVGATETEAQVEMEARKKNFLSPNGHTNDLSSEQVNKHSADPDAQNADRGESDHRDVESGLHDEERVEEEGEGPPLSEQGPAGETEALTEDTEPQTR